jgi:hypothetical protein
MTITCLVWSLPLPALRLASLKQCGSPVVAPTVRETLHYRGFGQQ